MKENLTLKLTFSAVCLALCMVLPLLTGQIPEIGSALSPMHLPVLLCGFLCGWQYGLLVGFVAPLLRFLLFGMPPIYPTGLSMCFELATYGAVCGLMSSLLPKKLPFLYVTLVSAMTLGRVVWGVARFIFASVSQKTFTFQMFLAGAFVDAVPGIICQIVLVPLIVFALAKANLAPNWRQTPSEKPQTD